MAIVKKTPLQSITKLGAEIGKIAYLTGPKGDKGDTGPIGPQGLPGNDGKDGATGPQGAQGIAGRDGVDGKDGKDGRDGKDGVTTTVVKEVAIDLSDIKQELSALGSRCDKLEKQATSKTSGQSNQAAGKWFPDTIYATGDVSVGTNDTTVICSASGTVYLPPKPVEDQNVIVKQGGDSVAITIDGRGKYIDGATTYVIPTVAGSTTFTGIHLLYARSKWYIV